MLFSQIGQLFESYAVGRSRESIASLMNIRPDSATVLREGRLITVDPYNVGIGEIIVVEPGEKIPLDGIVRSGASSIDSSGAYGRIAAKGHCLRKRSAERVHKPHGRIGDRGNKRIRGINRIKDT